MASNITRCDNPEVEHPGFPCGHPPIDPELEAPARVREYRKGNLFLMVEDEGDDRYFWQFQEGVRKRVPVASGILDGAGIASMVEKFTEGEVSR